MFSALGRFARTVWGLPAAAGTLISMVAIMGGYWSNLEKKHALPEVAYEITHSGLVGAPITQATVDQGVPVIARLVGADLAPYADDDLHVSWHIVRDDEVIARQEGGTSFTFNASVLTHPTQMIDGQVPAPGVGQRYALVYSARKDVRHLLYLRKSEVRVGSLYKQLPVQLGPTILPAFPVLSSDPAAAVPSATSATTPSATTAAGSTPQPATPAAVGDPSVGLIGGLSTQ